MNGFVNVPIILIIIIHCRAETAEAMNTKFGQWLHFIIILENLWRGFSENSISKGTKRKRYIFLVVYFLEIA